MFLQAYFAVRKCHHKRRSQPMSRTIAVWSTQHSASSAWQAGPSSSGSVSFSLARASLYSTTLCSASAARDASPSSVTWVLACYSSEQCADRLWRDPHTYARFPRLERESLKTNKVAGSADVLSASLRERQDPECIYPCEGEELCEWARSRCGDRGVGAFVVL